MAAGERAGSEDETMGVTGGKSALWNCDQVIEFAFLERLPFVLS